MPETRIVERVYKNGVLVEEITAEISDEELYQEQLEQEFNDVHDKAILALKNWDSLTPAQKDIILKNLLKWVLWTNRRLKLGVL